MMLDEIQVNMEEIYGMEISPGIISTVTDAVLNRGCTHSRRASSMLCPHTSIRARAQVKVKRQGSCDEQGGSSGFGFNFR
jgi:hypothetical protein